MEPQNYSKAKRITNRFNEMRRVLRYFASRIVGNQDAEDILQTAVMKAFKHAENLREEDDVESWLLTTTRHSALDYRRMVYHQREIPTEIDDKRLYLADPSPSPEELAIRKEIADIVNGEVERLPPEQREAMEMFYLKGIRMDEIAERQNVPLDTVKSRLRYVRKKLMTAVQE